MYDKYLVIMVASSMLKVNNGFKAYKGLACLHLVIGSQLSDLQLNFEEGAVSWIAMDSVFGLEIEGIIV